MTTYPQRSAIETNLKENEVMSSKQKTAVKEAIGDSKQWPKMTADPRVNCQVDVIVCKSPPWQSLSTIMKEVYKQEAKIFGKGV